MITHRSPAAAAACLVLVAAGAARSQSKISTGTTIQASLTSSGVPGNASTWDCSLSGNGRYVAVHSYATNYVANDDNNANDVFLRDLEAGTTVLVSQSLAGGVGNRRSDSPVVSQDGRYVAFQSSASNLVAGDTNGIDDVFLRDVATGVTMLCSQSSSGVQQNTGGTLMNPTVSRDGTVVAYDSPASNLVPGDTNRLIDAFVREWQTGLTRRVSVGNNGAQGNHDSFSPGVSSDGMHVAFSSRASNLVTGDTNGYTDVFFRDRVLRTTSRISVSSSGTESNKGSGFSSVSADGRYIAFQSDGSNLVPGDTNNNADVFVHDRQTGETTRISVSSSGGQGNGRSYVPSISPDARYVAFTSSASNLVPGDTNGKSDVFVHDRLNGETERFSVAWNGSEGNGTANSASISNDGRHIAFVSLASNLMPQAGNSSYDVYVRDRGPWTDLGSALAGATSIPKLVGHGDLQPGLPAALALANAAPGAPAVLALSATSMPIAVLGGMFRAWPATIVLPLSTNAAGGITVEFVMPLTMPTGSEIYAQFLIADPGAVQGVAFSNAVVGVTP